MDIKIKVFKHGSGLDIPRHMTAGSAGVDLPAAIESHLVLKPMERKLIPTGFAISLPEGFEAQIRPRSGLASKNGVTVLNSPGTVDSDYRGEIKVLLVNLGSENFLIERGFRIAQMVIHRYEKVFFTPAKNLDVTGRSDGGYGSTGVL